MSRITRPFSGDEGDLKTYYYRVAKGMREQASKWTLEAFQGRTDEDLAAELATPHEVSTLEADPDRTEGAVPRITPRSTGHLPGDRVQAVYEIPLVPHPLNSFVLALSDPKGWTLYAQLIGAATYRERDHVLEICVDNSDRLGGLVSLAKEKIDHINNFIRAEEGNLQGQVAHVLRQRRAELEGHDQSFRTSMEKQGIVLRTKDDARLPVLVTEKPQVLQVRRVEKTVVGEAGEPTLTSEQTSRIVDLVYTLGRQFETAPGVYSKLTEPELADILVGLLNSVFAVVYVTRETFSKMGKTDLHLSVGDGPVLIGECLFWDGEQYYISKLEQLFGYVRWRHTAAILVTFSRNKGMTSVLESALEAARNHKTCIRTMRDIEGTRFVTEHRHPQDDDKILVIHHLLFDVYSGPTSQ